MTAKRFMSLHPLLIAAIDRDAQGFVIRCANKISIEVVSLSTELAFG
jgi:hypothetical protein